VRPDDLDALDRLGVDRKELARSLLRSTAEDVLEHGFFHADPHPGNLLVRSGPVITPIDFGLVGRLGRRQRDDLLELLAAVFGADSPRVVDLLDRMEILPAGRRRGALERDVQELIDRFTGGGLQQGPLAQLLGELLDVLSRHAVTAPSEFFLLARSFAIVEGLVRELAPEMDPAEELEPVATRLYLDRVSDPGFLGRDWTRTARRAAGLLRRAPARFDALLEQLETGRLRFQVASSTDPEALVRLSRGSRRIALAVLASAGFLGSILLLFAAAGPTVWELPLTHWLGFGGLSVSAIGGAAVAIGALVSRRG
jgi:ubiquinone biosynthesis protein